MAVSFVATTNVTGASVTSVAPTKPAGTANGDLILLFADWFNTTITWPTGFTTGENVVGSASASDNCGWAWKVASGEGASWTVNYGVATWTEVTAYVLRGCAASNPIKHFSHIVNAVRATTLPQPATRTIADQKDCTVYAYMGLISGNSGTSVVTSPGGLSDFTANTFTSDGGAQGIGWGIKVTSPGSATSVTALDYVDFFIDISPLTVGIARVQAFNSGNLGAASGTVTASMTNLTVGNGLIVCIGNQNTTASTTVSGVSDTANSYTQATGAFKQQGSWLMCDLWYCKSIATGGSLTCTVTFSSAAGGCALQVIEVSGQDTSAFIDKLQVASGNSTAPNSGATAATTQANEFVVGMVVNAANSIATVPTFSTVLTSQTTETFADETVAPKVGLSVWDGLLASSGVAETFSATQGAGVWDALCVTFLPAAAIVPPSISTARLWG